MNSFIAANLKQRPLRTGVSIFGVALGVILVPDHAGGDHRRMSDMVRDRMQRELDEMRGIARTAG